ncbi:MAG TPA: CBS domain-containing protein [Ktedonobacterales bacterium]|jgi:CBS domain-containing protein
MVNIQTMPYYLSKLLHRSVEDTRRERVGKLVDVIAPPLDRDTLRDADRGQAVRVAAQAPRIVALVVETPDEERLRVLPEQVARVEEDVMLLAVPRGALLPDAPQPNEVRLFDEVLDLEVVDLAHKRVVRVNDAQFDDEWRLVGLDCTHLGLLRQLVPDGIYQALARKFPSALLPWNQVALLPEAQVEGAPAAPPSGALNLAELHPADIADIVHHLSPEEGSRVLAALDDEKAAATLEEIETEHQLRLLERMDRERAADILEAMAPDEAADLLAKLPEARTQEFLGLMEQEESEDVQELLAYPEDSAGGMMTTDYLLIGQDRTTSQALERLRAAALEQEGRSAYLYCVADDAREDEKQQLLGVVSIWNLLAAAPEQPLREFMETHLISVLPDADPHTVAELMAKYNLLALPVLDEAGCLQGIVTVDDALDVLLPPSRRRRKQRMY